MTLISRLAEKSWLPPGGEGFADPADYRPAASTVGLYLYFGVATVIFTLLIAAYLVRMGVPGMEHGGAGMPVNTKQLSPRPGASGRKSGKNAKKKR